MKCSGTGRSAVSTRAVSRCGAVGEVLAQVGDVAERGAHQQELRLGEHQDRHLPRPAALRVGVEVELVHHDLADVGVLAFAQGDVREDLGGAGDDRRAAVDRRVAGEHADVLGAEDRAQGEELLAHERLDRGRVVRDLVGGHGREVRGDRDHRLAAAGRRGEDHVVAAEQLDRGLFLVRIEGEALLLAPRHERLVEGVGIVVAREGVDEAAGGHADQYGRSRPRVRGQHVPTGCGGLAVLRSVGAFGGGVDDRRLRRFERGRRGLGGAGRGRPAPDEQRAQLARRGARGWAAGRCRCCA